MSSKHLNQKAIAPSLQVTDASFMKSDRRRDKPSTLVLDWFRKLHQWDYIEAQATEGKPSWKTVRRHPLSAGRFYARWNDPNQLIGVRFKTKKGGETQYCVIDIDIGSNYHPYRDESAFWGILSALETIGLCRYIIVRSSYSEGLHVYFPLPTPVLCSKLAFALQEAICEGGYTLEAGQLELFPNVRSRPRSLYQAHRLPLQIGSYVVGDAFQPIHNSIETFVKTWNQIADQQDFSTLGVAIANAKPSYFYSSSNVLEEWRLRLEEVLEEGWTANGQTNKIVKEVCTYARVFKELSWEEVTPWVLKTVVNLPGYKQFCRHQHNIRRRIQDWVNQMKEEGRYYPCSLAREKQDQSPKISNEERQVDALRRIEDAIARIKVEQRALPGKVRELQQLICAIARCSASTLNKYRELWHPAHRPKECVTEPLDLENISAPALQREHQNSTVSDRGIDAGASEVESCVIAHIAGISSTSETAMDEASQDEITQGCVTQGIARDSATSQQIEKHRTITESQSESTVTHPTLLSVYRASSAITTKKSDEKAILGSSTSIAARREEICSGTIRVNSIVQHHVSQRFFKVKCFDSEQTVWAECLFELASLVNVILSLSELRLVPFHELQSLHERRNARLNQASTG